MFGNKYMTVETTNVTGSVCFSMQSDEPVENGAIVGKGELIEGEDSIYEALSDYSDGMYLVAHPAWSYHNSIIAQNEENYINKAGKAFRTYQLKKDMKFTIGNVNTETPFEKGDYLEFKNGAYVKAASNTELKVEQVIEDGFPYCIGSQGVRLTDDEDNIYGYAIDTRTKKYVVRVVK